MGRYLIIDTKKPLAFREGELYDKTGTFKGIILSPEETEAKFKEIFDYGVSTGMTDLNCGGVGWKEIESNWNELKETL